MYCLKYCVLVAGFLSFTATACQLGDTGAMPTLPISEKLCRHQGEGFWTFALYSEAVEVPSIAGGGNSGYSAASSYQIYDNTCTLRGRFNTRAKDCDIPFVIEANYLQQVLTIQSQDTMVGGGYFRFAYGNGLFSIGNNGCECQDMSHGLTAAEGCGCAFPVNGVL